MSALSEEALQYLAGLVVPSKGIALQHKEWSGNYTIVLFSAGDTVYRCGDDPDFLYFVLRGA